jgi:hypothetical protein
LKRRLHNSILSGKQLPDPPAVKQATRPLA